MLDVLSSWCYSAYSTEWPKALAQWIPDWSQHTPDCAKYGDIRPLYVGPYGAARNYPARPELVRQINALILRGVGLMTVAGLSKLSLEI